MNQRVMKVLVAAVMAMAVPGAAMASSHREAPATTISPSKPKPSGRVNVLRHGSTLPVK